MDFFESTISSYLNGTSDIGPKESYDNVQKISLKEDGGWFRSGITYDKFMDAYETMDVNKPLELTIRTNGGEVTKFLSIGWIIVNHKGKTTAIIDRYAYSGGTLLALLCDEIVMSEHSALGGINPYILLPINSGHIKRVSDVIGKTWMNVIFEYLKDMEDSVLKRFTLMLAKKYREDEVNTIIDYFVFEVDHNLPLYQSMLPMSVQKKITKPTSNSAMSKIVEAMGALGLRKYLSHSLPDMSKNMFDDMPKNMFDGTPKNMFDDIDTVSSSRSVSPISPISLVTPEP